MVWATAGLAAMILSAPAAPADPRDSKAVQDYVRQQQAQESKDHDERVAAHIDALANNSGSPLLANAGGDVTIVEFFDYTCPYCKAAEPRLMRLVDGNKRIKLVTKEFPILTRVSMVASRMALAAARQGKYRAFHLAMMRRDGQWGEAEVMETAKAVGVDVARARREMYAPDITDEIIANFNLARAIRVFQTPAYIVGTHLVTGNSADIDFAKEVARVRK
jgi:protein-disulfide isomerase